MPKVSNKNSTKKVETNEEFMVRLLNFAKSGPMMHIFIFEALNRYADSVASTPKEKLRQQFAKNSAQNFINPDAWHACAVELRDELAKKFGLPPKEEGK